MKETFRRAAGAVCRFLPKYLYAGVASLFLFTYGVFVRRHRFLIFRIAKHFGMKTPIEAEQLPILPLGPSLIAMLQALLSRRLVLVQSLRHPVVARWATA